MPTKDASGVHIVKSGSGDIMLIVPIDKKTAATLKNQDVAVAVVNKFDVANIVKCGALYKIFRFREDLIQRPVARLIK
jgi:hypothetical protein